MDEISGYLLLCFFAFVLALVVRGIHREFKEELERWFKKYGPPK